MISEETKPLLPLRDIVIFPSIIAPLFVGRKKSIKFRNAVVSLGLLINGFEPQVIDFNSIDLKCFIFREF